MNVETEKNFDVKRYMGKWYEIAKIPFVWEVGCSFSEAEYSWDEDKQIINVKNSCLDGNKNVKRVSLGTATILDVKCPSKLKIVFEENPNVGYYFILFTDYDNYSIVGGPTKQFLWILSRTSTVPLTDLPFLLNKVKYFGYNSDKIISNEKFFY
jgi:apolipoprotein D and lipocalin family protein